VSDENSPKIELTDLLSAFKMQFLSHCYRPQAQFGRTIANLVAHMIQFTIWQKKSILFKYGFPKCLVLLIDSVLKINVYLCGEWLGVNLCTNAKYTHVEKTLDHMFKTY
jgi:hypothetical protein